MAKMVNFGLAYGMSDFGLSSRAGISRAGGPGVHQLVLRGVLRDQLLHAPHQGDGPARRASSRRSSAGSARSRSSTPRTRALRGAGERMAINMPIQGTAADIVKIAMIRLDARLAAEGFRARLLLQVHDELLLEVPRDEVDRLIPVLREVDGGRAAARRPADRRREGRRRLGIDGPGHAPGRGPRRGSPRRRRGLTRPTRSRREADVPELPEVETVARDLRGLVLDATISGATCRWARTLRTHDPETFAAGRRRPPDRWPSGGAASSSSIDLVRRGDPDVHLKMTGQLFVVPAAAPARSARPAGDRLRRRPRAPLPGHPQVRPGRAVRASIPRPARRSSRPAGRPSSPGPARSRSTTRSPSGPSGGASGPGAAGSSRSSSTSRSSPGSATSTPTRRCGRLASTRCAPPRPSGRPTSGACTAAVRRILAEAIERRGELDRRLHGARGRRLDAGAAPRLPAGRRALPALRPADPADRRRRARDALLLVVPAPARGAIGPGRRRSSAAMTPRPGRTPGPRGRRWSELDGEAALGRTADEAAAGPSAPGPGPSGPAGRPPRATGARPGPPAGTAA